MSKNESICRKCFHSYVCEQFNKHRDDDNQKCHFFNDHFVYSADVIVQEQGEWIEDGYYDVPCVCSICGEEAQYISRFKETFEYDWEENLVPMGYEEIREYIKTPYCSRCGAKLKEWGK